MRITLTETAQTGDGFQAWLVFEDFNHRYSVTVRPPFDAEQEAELEWYFEQHLRFPFINNVRYRDAAASVRAYGEALFNQLFVDRKAYRDYGDALRSGFELEILGSVAFHALHWESVQDPDRAKPLALDHVVVRKPLNLNPAFQPITPQASPLLNILLVVARPDKANDVSYRTISRPLVEMVRDARLPVNLEILRPGTYQALMQHLETVSNERGKGFYHAIHFDLHGAVLSWEQIQAGHAAGRLVFYDYGRAELQKFEGKQAFIFLQHEESGKSTPIAAADLTRLLTQHGIPLVILNACQSAKQVGADSETSLASHLMQSGAQVVVAMAYSVTVSAAEVFMHTLYQQLFSAQPLPAAIRRGRFELFNQKSRRAYYNERIELEDWMLPVVYQSRPPVLPLRAFTAQEEAAYFERDAARFTGARPEYGFFGRDLDILEIEERLLTRRNILLVQGMGGAGKTSLLTHLGEWWQTTRFVGKVCYFGFDQKAWTPAQILRGIAEALLGKEDMLRRFQPLNEGAQRAMLARLLRGERHLLILDNLESVTGAALAIQHTLNAKQQAALRAFVAELAGGQTLVLLGSRGDEAWLRDGTFADNRYRLPGLDKEAASNLADEILKRRHAEHLRSDAEHRQALNHLLQLLGGFPLALEVVLSNLPQKSPAEVLAALQGGDAGIDPLAEPVAELVEAKTKSILRCIEYSHSNLSPAAQQLLLCLAPFVGVVPAQLLPQYTEFLQQQPALAKLPFAQWAAVLAEAKNWGLLTAHELPIYLRIQPTLPYFLRHRLQRQETLQAEIETAFRLFYEQIGDALGDLLQSKDPQQKQLGQALTGLEYENLHQALFLALEAQVSSLNLWLPLSLYLDTTQDHARGLELGQQVLARMEQYPPQTLRGQVGAGFVGVIDEIAKRFLLSKQYTEAEQAYQKALKIWTDNGFDREPSASIYHQLGIVAQAQRQWQQAVDYYQQALDIKIEFNDRYAQAGTYHQLGSVAQAQRQWQQAADYYQQALDIYIEFNDRAGQARLYHHFGIVAQAQRQWQQAADYYQQALDINIEFNDRYEQAGTYHQLGSVAQAQRQWQQAADYYQQALDIFIEFNDRHYQARVYHQLGIVAQAQEQWQQAADYYQQALDIKIEFNDRYAQASTYHNLGSVAQAQRQWQQAADYYQQALDIYIEFNDRYAQASTYHQLGSVAEEQEEWQQAIDYFLRAWGIFAEYQDEHSLEIVGGSLARVYQSQPQIVAAALQQAGEGALLAALAR